MFASDIITHPYHLETIKTLTSLVPAVIDEVQLAVPEAFKVPESGSVSVPLFETMVHLLARISNRAMIGAPGCRNEEFLRRQVSVAEQAIPMSQVLNWFPQIMRPAIWKLFSMIAGSKDEAIRLLVPYIQYRIQYAQQVQDNPETITDLLLRYAPEEHINSPEKLAVRVVHLNMASIHTSAIFTTHALFELAKMSPEQIDMIRTEIKSAMESEGGICNKTAVGKFHMLDSLLREIGRFHSLFSVGSSRLTLRDATLADGTVIPEGSVVALAPKPLHLNPEVYSQPEVFDPFRFSKLRQNGKDTLQSDAKHSFTTLTNNYIVFGTGKHACPGRFFAAFMVKIILAEILLAYDISFPEGASKNPRSFSFNIFTVPNPKAKLCFTKHKASSESE
ncbi:hypothetical protein M422DRAFT_156013 [Sphaerobolus stellatus SS14]|nr:hypothetical protein M422DRAFT_156013 [Sphaerobolus stellatus SS14]